MVSPPLRIRIKIAPVNMARARRWGDFFFASSLARAFTERGHDAVIQTRDMWGDAAPGDVSLVLRGFAGYQPVPSHVNLMWIISHPGSLAAGELDPYDHVFAASARGLRSMRRLLGAGRVSSLLQATDPAIMRPREDAIASDILFVGVNRRGGRPALEMADKVGLDLALYGAGWATHERFARWLRADLIPNEDLGRHYAGARVVLNDHWRDMRLKGYLSNRVFDVLACGGVLVSDEVAGLPDDLAEWIYTWSDEASFRAAIKAARGEDETRRADRRAFAATIAKEHSFAARAAAIERVALDLLGRADDATHRV